MANRAHGLHSVWHVGMWQWMETAKLHLVYYAHEDEAFLHEVIMMEGMWPCSCKPWVQETVKWMTSPRVSMPKKKPWNCSKCWILLELPEHHLCPTLCVRWPHLHSGPMSWTMKFGVMWQGWWSIIQAVKLGGTWTFTVLARHKPMWLWLLETKRKPYEASNSRWKKGL